MFDDVWVYFFEMLARVFHVLFDGSHQSGRYISTSTASYTSKMYVGWCRTRGIEYRQYADAKKQYIHVKYAYALNCLQASLWGSTWETCIFLFFFLNVMKVLFVSLNLKLTKRFSLEILPETNSSFPVKDEKIWNKNFQAWGMNSQSSLRGRPVLALHGWLDNSISTETIRRSFNPYEIWWKKGRGTLKAISWGEIW